MLKGLTMVLAGGASFAAGPAVAGAQARGGGGGFGAGHASGFGVNHIPGMGSGIGGSNQAETHAVRLPSATVQLSADLRAQPGGRLHGPRRGLADSHV
jgi:hypothetical protein